MYLLTFATNNKNPLNFPNQILIPLWHVSVVLGGQIGSGRVGGYNLYIHQLFVFCCCFFLFNVYLFYLLLFWFWTIALVFLSFVCCSPVVVAVVVCYCVITVFSSIVVCIHTQHKIVVIISPLSIFFSSPFIITIFICFCSVAQAGRQAEGNEFWISVLL